MLHDNEISLLSYMYNFWNVPMLSFITFKMTTSFACIESLGFHEMMFLSSFCGNYSMFLH